MVVLGVAILATVGIYATLGKEIRNEVSLKDREGK